MLPNSLNLSFSEYWIIMLLLTRSLIYRLLLTRILAHYGTLYQDRALLTMLLLTRVVTHYVTMDLKYDLLCKYLPEIFPTILLLLRILT